MTTDDCSGELSAPADQVVANHPLIHMREGETGSRPALLAGPEIVDVIGAIVGGDVPHAQRRGRAAALLSLPMSAVDAALAYYTEFAAEIDADLADRCALAAEHEAQWRWVRAGSEISGDDDLDFTGAG